MNLNNPGMELKCSQMSFSELESLKTLINITYEKFVHEAETPEDVDGFEKEYREYADDLDKVIANKVVLFMGLGES